MFTVLKKNKKLPRYDEHACAACAEKWCTNNASEHSQKGILEYSSWYYDFHS